MKINLFTIYIDDKDVYGFDFITINAYSLFSIQYEKFYKRFDVELFFRQLI